MGLGPRLNLLSLLTVVSSLPLEQPRGGLNSGALDRPPPSAREVGPAAAAGALRSLPGSFLKLSQSCPFSSVAKENSICI